METTTDCREPVGITVGLIDAIISILRVLSNRDMNHEEVREALLDLRDDEDFRMVLDKLNTL